MPTLQWLTRDEDVTAADAVTYKLLEEVPELGAGDPDTGNMLIQGDNLEALKALLPFYAGRVRCVFIDPPYNTRSAFEHYDDNLEHSKWLALMYPRLALLRDFLSTNGSIWITLDDHEVHYAKVILDEIFGRKNFVASIAWQKVFAKKNKAMISGSHDHMLVYCRDVSKWERNLLPRNDDQMAAFGNKDNDERGPWQSVAYSVQSEDSERRLAYRYNIKLPSGREVGPPAGRHWNGLPDRTEALRADNRLWFGQDGDRLPRLKVFLSEVQTGVVPDTWWDHKSSGSNQDSKKEQVALFPEEEPFGTPKPEELIRRVMSIASNPQDLIMDSFLGSGTTAAVAQKMGRQYIGIEYGEHARTYCQPRLRKVTEGEQGGISKTVEWRGGSGFRFYRLGPSVFDDQGQIREDIEFETLAAHIWFSELEAPWNAGARNGTVLGANDKTALALLYNGVLRDRSVNGGNVLTRSTLRIIREDLPAGFDGTLTVYGERCILSDATLERENIIFKQTPYDVKARA
ncbi:MAG: site-specific DNA-methyltransferase [Erythrobacter sp.]